MIRAGWIVRAKAGGVVVCVLGSSGCDVTFEEVSALRPALAAVFLTYTDSLGTESSELAGIFRSAMDVDGAVVEVDDPAFTVGAYRIPLRPRVDAEIGTYEGSIPIGPGPLEAQMGLRVRGPSLPDGAQAPEGELPSLHWRSAQDLIQDSTGALRVEWESGGGPANDSTDAGSWLLTVEPSDPGPPGAPRRRLVMQGQGPPPRPLDIGAAFVPGAGPWRVRLEITETRRDLRDAWEFRGTTRSQLIWIAQPASAAP